MKTIVATVIAAACALTISVSGRQSATLRIISPDHETVVSGPTRFAVSIEPASAISTVRTVTFTVNGRLACTVEKPPFACSWDPGDVVRAYQVRVVAALADGSTLKNSVWTKDLGFTEHARTEAVVVPVIVTHGGQFVRGLKQKDFEVVEDGVKQSIATLVDENSPLDLVLAIDVSGSMEHALPDVKVAVKQLLSRLRTGDAATIIGFNDTMFLAAEREKNQAERERAVDLLESWGGTSLYDATVPSDRPRQPGMGAEGHRDFFRRRRSQ